MPRVDPDATYYRIIPQDHPGGGKIASMFDGVDYEFTAGSEEIYPEEMALHFQQRLRMADGTELVKIEPLPPGDLRIGLVRYAPEVFRCPWEDPISGDCPRSFDAFPDLQAHLKEHMAGMGVTPEDDAPEADFSIANLEQFKGAVANGNGGGEDDIPRDKNGKPLQGGALMKALQSRERAREGGRVAH